MTTTPRERVTLPTCPPYCTDVHRGIADWDGPVNDDGMTGYIRPHSGGPWPTLRDEDGHYVVGLWVGTYEHEDGTLEPTDISIDLRSGARLTPKQARPFGRYLNEAADVAEVSA